jgi:hypothetical protein
MMKMDPGIPLPAGQRGTVEKWELDHADRRDNAQAGT